MAKKKIEPGTPSGGGIAWVDLDPSDPAVVAPLSKLEQYIEDQALHPYLGKVGLEVYEKWKAIIAKRSGWKDEFEEVVSLAASQYEIYIDQTQLLQIEGMTVEHRNGAIGQNPRVNIQQSAWKNVFTFSNRFGFNPLFEGKVSKHEDDDSEI
jgi:P27 family predicted phage terminase small subunit